jgi:hypothetical protein
VLMISSGEISGFSCEVLEYFNFLFSKTSKCFSEITA